MKRLAANGLQTLDEEHGRKRSAANLVRDVPLVLFDPDRRELVGKVRVAQVAPLQFGL
jgi:hypothetical protein